MPKHSRTHRAAIQGLVATVALIALLAAGARSPVQAQKLLSGVFAGSVVPSFRAPSSGGFYQAPEGVTVNSPDELVNRLLDPNFTGKLFIPRDVQWDMTGYRQIPLHSGVSLLGGRGVLGSRPLLYTTDKADKYALFEITSNDVRVESLHLRGPAAGDRSSTQPYVFAISILEDPDLQRGRRVVIADNELDEWTGGGVSVNGTHNVRLPGDYDPSWSRIRPEDVGLVRVEGNYIHHNARDDGGYGVVVNGGAYATIEGNVFNFNRHAVASHGFAHSGYLARFNYVLEGGFKQGSFYNQHFDVHGSNDGGYGGPAGEYYEIANNTIRGDQTYYAGLATRPALMLRGRPEIGLFFHDNLLVHNDLDSAVSLKWEKGASGFFNNDDYDYNFHDRNNQYDTDHSTEISAGDFDGDGRTDVFLATGTAWFYSRGGSQPWTFLQASSLLTQDLAFADIDHDGTTDVLWRAPNGTFYYWKGGKGAAVALTHVPVPVNELRFGDFDGDGRTDIFYTFNRSWNFWYSSTRTWSSPGGSSLPLSELLFGDFDGDGRTDIVGVANGHWSISSSGAQPWAKLNDKLTNSFTGAVVGDFDGEGKSDIAYNDGKSWYYSRGGRGPRALLRGDAFLDPYASLKSLLLGHFDAGRRTEVVSFERQVIPRIGGSGGGLSYNIAIGGHLVIWRGQGSGDAFSLLSPQNMR